jgi:hypothetical protein
VSRAHEKKGTDADNPQPEGVQATGASAVAFVVIAIVNPAILEKRLRDYLRKIFVPKPRAARQGGREIRAARQGARETRAAHPTLKRGD